MWYIKYFIRSTQVRLMPMQERNYYRDCGRFLRKTPTNNDNPMIMDRIKEIFEPFQVDADKMMKELGNNI